MPKMGVNLCTKQETLGPEIFSPRYPLPKNLGLSLCLLPLHLPTARPQELLVLLTRWNFRESAGPKAWTLDLQRSLWGEGQKSAFQQPDSPPLPYPVPPHVYRKAALRSKQLSAGGEAEAWNGQTPELGVWPVRL